MSIPWNGVELRNNIGPEVDGTSGNLRFRHCFICEEKIRIGDDVLYCFKQRGTQSASSCYLHPHCLPQIKLDGKAGKVTCRGHTITVQANKTKCSTCGKTGCTFVAVTRQYHNVGFHEECIKDKRLLPQEVAAYKIKRQKALERTVVAKRVSSHVDDINLSLETRTRRDGKLVSASCYISHWAILSNQHHSEHIILFQSCKWQRQKGELRLNLLLNWPNEIRQKIITHLDNLLDGYDDKGYEKVRVPVEC